MSALVVAGDVSGTCTLQAPSAAGSTVLTLPVIATDTLAGIAATQTLTNKTLVAVALGTPASGVLTNCTGVVAGALPAGSVLQVVSTTKTDTFSSAVISTWTDITGMSVTITPSSASSKIFVAFSCIAVNTTSNAYLRIVRGSTAICVGTTAGSRSSSSTGNLNMSGGNALTGQSNNYLDSPSATTATTYKLQFITDAATTYVNRSSGDTDFLYVGRAASTITVMEIAG